MPTPSIDRVGHWLPPETAAVVDPEPGRGNADRSVDADELLVDPNKDSTEGMVILACDGTLDERERMEWVFG